MAGPARGLRSGAPEAVGEAGLRDDPRAHADYDADFTQRTAGVQARVLVITGDRDHAIGPDHYRKFQFPHQTVQHIDGSHLLYYEHSAAFVAAIRGWIAAP